MIVKGGLWRGSAGGRRGKEIKPTKNLKMRGEGNWAEDCGSGGTLA
jgi:hypothetical protein